MSQVFDSLSSLVASVRVGSAESAFMVRYRNKDTFVLATDEDAAVRAVVEEMGVQVGLVPLDLLIQASRSSPATEVVAGNPPAKKGKKGDEPNPFGN